LSDFADAPQESLPGDARLLEQARSRVRELNARHPGPSGNRFHLLHRRRLWNPVDKIWMGWERKRGKLLELNRLLRGALNTSYLEAGALTDDRPAVRFVITLDADTRLPHGAARKLVGTLTHPLNRPHFGEDQRRVTQGYAVLQPRVTVSLASAGR